DVGPLELGRREHLGDRLARAATCRGEVLLVEAPDEVGARAVAPQRVAVRLLVRLREALPDLQVGSEPGAPHRVVAAGRHPKAPLLLVCTTGVPGLRTDPRLGRLDGLHV